MTASAQTELVFILGREPHISIAELFAVLGDQVTWNTAALGQEALAVSTHGIDIDALMRRVAGTIKIGKIWRTVPQADSDETTAAIGQYILGHSDENRKVCFGYSVYDAGGGDAAVRHARKTLDRGAKEMKQWLVGQGRKARHVTDTAAQLSSVTVQRQKLLPRQNGVEVLVLVGSSTISLAQTMAVQPYRAWGDRDYGRPARDARSGMLPPKLARTMLNLAHLPPGGTLLDPFCGSGTVLTEAIALDVGRIIGMDDRAQAVQGAQKNVDWIRSSFPAPKNTEQNISSPSVTITQCNVHDCASRLIDPIDAVVSEPYLGPTRGRPTPTITQQLHDLYRAAFSQFVQVLRPGGRVVFIVPVFREDAWQATVRIEHDTGQIGFSTINPFPEALRDHPILIEKKDLPYAREGQRIGRRILVFEKRR
jgi:tRNA G10  N-methylase Trm11